MHPGHYYRKLIVLNSIIKNSNNQKCSTKITTFTKLKQKAQIMQNDSKVKQINNWLKELLHPVISA